MVLKLIYPTKSYTKALHVFISLCNIFCIVTNSTTNVAELYKHSGVCWNYCLACQMEKNKFGRSNIEMWSKKLANYDKGHKIMSSKKIKTLLDFYTHKVLIFQQACADS